MNDKCKHDFKVLDIKYSKQEDGYRAFTWKRTTTFYCAKCLCEEITKLEQWSREVPDWWKSSN